MTQSYFSFYYSTILLLAIIIQDGKLEKGGGEVKNFNTDLESRIWLWRTCFNLSASLSLKESCECFSTWPTSEAGKDTTISPVTFTRQSLGLVLLNMALHVSWKAMASGMPVFNPVVVLVGVVEGEGPGNE